MKRIVWTLCLLIGAGRLSAQTTVSFNFSAASQPVAGWINVAGDPSTGLRTATDPVSRITISSIAPANWAPERGVAANDGQGAPGGTFFPAGVMHNHWFQYNGPVAVYNPNVPQLLISGLRTDSVYTLQMTGSSTSNLNSSPTEYTVSGLSVTGPIAVNNHNNTASGAVFYDIVPDASGNIKIYINTLPTTAIADICGIRIISSSPPSARGGQGVSVSRGTLNLGDTVTAVGPHSFTSDRYQNLNGHLYSFGDIVNDPVAHPAFRIYGNGDLTAGTTMDRSVSTANQTGLRYYAKPGYLQIGASDRIDTTQNPIVYGIWPSSGIVINTDNANLIKGKIMNTVFAADASRIDSGAWMENNFVTGENLAFSIGSANTTRSFIGGYGTTFSAPVETSIVDVQGASISKRILDDMITGYGHLTQDVSIFSMIGGDRVQFGGLGQFACGQFLINRTPYGAVLGNANVDFSTLPYTGYQGTNVANIGSYPLFALGNSAVSGNYLGSLTTTSHSNAFTVLYNGRTQINTTGLTNNLAQADVTPKAALDVVSTNTGVLLPRLTTAQRNGIVSGDLQNGLLLYNTDSSVFQFYNGTAWSSVGNGLGSGGRWQFLSGAIYDSLDNIGIGTSNTQGYKLAVNGNVIVSRIKVKAAGAWPDYVFRKDYRLPRLKDLERYIAGYRHLPGLPSAAEVKREGQDVGEMQAALLKKVEELTLYVIELDKKVESLQQENRRLKRQQGVLHRGKHKPI